VRLDRYTFYKIYCTGWESKSKKYSKANIAVRNKDYRTAVGNHVPYGTYNVPVTRRRRGGDFLAFTLAKAGIRFIDPSGIMQGWVELVVVISQDSLSTKDCHLSKK